MAAAHGGSAWRPHGGLSPPACAVPCLSLRVYESSLRLYSGTGGAGGGGKLERAEFPAFGAARP